MSKKHKTKTRPGHTLGGIRISPELWARLHELKREAHKTIPWLTRRAVARMIEVCDERKGAGLEAWLKSETTFIKWLCGE